MRTFVIFMLLALLTGTFAALAQDDPAALAVDINRANELAYLKLVRNERMPDLMGILWAPQVKTFTPFNPTGADTTAQQSVLDERVFQTAFTYVFTESVVLAEGDLTGVAVYQAGDFVGEYFGTPPTGKRQGGTMLWIDRMVDGRVVEAYTAWNQQSFMQDMGWATTTYPLTTVEPWGIKLGTTSSTPAEHHAVLNKMVDGLCTGCNPDFSAFYADTVVVHDYTANYEGLAAASEQFSKLTLLPDLNQDKTLSVCEGDLCVSYLVLSFAGADGPVPLIWAAVHRFDAGKIVEEWWQYDNSVLWPTLDAMK